MELESGTDVEGVVPARDVGCACWELFDSIERSAVPFATETEMSLERL